MTGRRVKNQTEFEREVLLTQLSLKVRQWHIDGWKIKLKSKNSNVEKGLMLTVRRRVKLSEN